MAPKPESKEGEASQAAGTSATAVAAGTPANQARAILVQIAAAGAAEDGSLKLSKELHEQLMRLTEPAGPSLTPVAPEEALAAALKEALQRLQTPTPSALKPDSAPAFDVAVPSTSY